MSQFQFSARFAPGQRLWQIWLKALTQPNLETYQQIAQTHPAALGKSVRQLAASAFFGGLFSGILIWLFGSLGLSQLFRILELPLQTNQFSILILLPLAAVIGLLSLALIAAGLVHLAARFLGGSGKFEQVLTAFAAFLAPLGIAVLVFIAVPYLSCLVPPVVLYGFILSVIANRAAHQYSAAKALLASLLAVGAAVVASIGFLSLLLLVSRFFV